MQSGADGVLALRTGMCRTVDDVGGHEGALLRAQQLLACLREVIAQVDPDLLVHEIPPVGSRMIRPESSLLAAFALHVAGAGMRPVVMLGAQQVKKRLTGNAKAEKSEVKAAVLHLCPGAGALKPMNTNVTDAIGLGLVAAERSWVL